MRTSRASWPFALLIVLGILASVPTRTSASEDAPGKPDPSSQSASWAEHRSTRVLYAGFEGGSRWKSFEGFLSQWFDTVGTLPLADLDEKTAAGYDVIITDWTSHYGNDGYSEERAPFPKQLGPGFARPVIALDYTGARLRRDKIDWL